MPRVVLPENPGPYSLENALKDLRRQMIDDGIFDEMRARQFAMSKSQRRKFKSAAARKAKHRRIQRARASKADW